MGSPAKSMKWNNAKFRTYLLQRGEDYLVIGNKIAMLLAEREVECLPQIIFHLMAFFPIYEKEIKKLAP